MLDEILQTGQAENENGYRASLTTKSSERISEISSQCSKPLGNHVNIPTLLGQTKLPKNSATLGQSYAPVIIRFAEGILFGLGTAVRPQAPSISREWREWSLEGPLKTMSNTLYFLTN